MVVMILGSGFEPVEAIAPCDILRRGGVEVQLAGIGTATACPKTPSSPCTTRVAPSS